MRTVTPRTRAPARRCRHLWDSADLAAATGRTEAEVYAEVHDGRLDESDLFFPLFEIARRGRFLPDDADNRASGQGFYLIRPADLWEFMAIGPSALRHRARRGTLDRRDPRSVIRVVAARRHLRGGRLLRFEKAGNSEGLVSPGLDF